MNESISAKKKICRVALVSLICSIIPAGIVLMVFMVLEWWDFSVSKSVGWSIFGVSILSLVAAPVLAITALIRIRKSKNLLGGKRPATASLVLSLIMISIVAVFHFCIACRGCPGIRPSRLMCGSNLKGLGTALKFYAHYSDGQWPSGDRWCDLLIEEADVTRKALRCPKAEEGTSNYAMNENAAKLGTKMPGDMVLIFESKPGWNMIGGPELLTMENHDGQGCHMLFGDGSARFVRSDELSNLRWKTTEE